TDAHPASIPNLAKTAINAGYTVIVFDAPPSQIAASAIAAANRLVLVARASQEGAYRTAVAYQTITEQLEGIYRVDPANVRVTLNRLQRGHGLAPDVWHSRVSAMTSGFPPVTASIPDLPQVLDLQDKRVLPVQQDDEYRESITPLANSLFGNQRGENGKTYIEERKIFGIKVRW
ncbi:MAG: ParA family protein, partial [Chloroflexota bacterium]|nr:ParA family protein [Chloroflexota bacterium]